MKTILAWSYTVFAFAVGAGFLAWAASQNAAAADYRNAAQCGRTVTSHCYQLLPGAIKSVQVSQSKSGEHDQVVLLTDAGQLRATLLPTSIAASHLRTGASVVVQRYANQVMLVEVDGYGVASDVNPAATRDLLSLYGWLFIAFGVLSVAVDLLRRWRRNRRGAALAGGLSSTRPEPVQPVLLPSGRIGREVRPQPSRGILARHGVGAAMLLLLTSRAMSDPARMGWMILVDAVLLTLWAAALLLFFRNAHFFAAGDEIGKTDLLGRTQTWQLADISRAERFSVAIKAGKNKHLVFVKQDGHKAFEIAGQPWDFDRLDALVRETGIRMSGSYEEEVGAFSLNKRVPGLTNWAQQAAVLVVILVLVIPLVMLLGGPTTR